jgi:hypothetical protein
MLFCENGNRPSGFVNGVGFLDTSKVYQLSENAFAQRRSTVCGHKLTVFIQT